MATESVLDLLKCVESLSSREMMKWALRNLRETLDILNVDVESDEEYKTLVMDVTHFFTYEKRVGDMRASALKMHEAARASKDETRANLLRAYGHILATAHIREHALHATDSMLSALRCGGISEAEVCNIAIKQAADLETLARFSVSVDSPK